MTGVGGDIDDFIYLLSLSLSLSLQAMTIVMTMSIVFRVRTRPVKVLLTIGISMLTVTIAAVTPPADLATHFATPRTVWRGARPAGRSGRAPAYWMGFRHGPRAYWMGPWPGRAGPCPKAKP